jgi:hypothetical protein
MGDTLQPPKPSGFNKLVIVFLVGGLVVLGVAGFVLYQREAEPAPAPPPPPPKPELVATPAPLVIADPTPPTPLAADAGTEEAPAVLTYDKPKKRRGGGGGGGGGGGPMGTIDAREVDRYINSRFGEVKACYEHRLKTNSFLEGKLDLNIAIKPNGRAGGITVNRDTVKDSQMLSCVKRQISGWKFPKPEGGRAVVAKTFNFKKAQ